MVSLPTKTRELERAYQALEKQKRELEEKNQEILRAQAELVQRTVYLNTLIESSPLATIVHDTDRRVTLCNPASAVLFGYSQSEILGQILDESIADERWKQEAERLTELVLQGQPVHRPETRRRRKDGSELVVELHGVPLIVNGEVIGAFAVYQDISERKRLEQQMLQTEKMALLGQLVAGVAHEINNPINFISSGLPSLERDIEKLSALVPSAKQDAGFEKLRQRLHKLMQAIGEGAYRTAEIVRDLRAFSRLDSATLRTADLHEALDSTLTLLRNQTKGRIEVVKTYGAIPPVECHISQINQVFMNLLTNAIQAIDGKGTIRIATDRHGEDHVEITIRDSGRGIEPERQGKIFDPFFTTKPVGEGTGLGLSISHGIVEKHRGAIAVRSTPGAGTEVRVTLPVKSLADRHSEGV